MATTNKKNKSDKKNNKANNYWETRQKLEREGKKLFKQEIFQDWCKACGICIAFCPANVFKKDKQGRPVVKEPDACTGCRFCELHCPDFAISIHDRYPDRRKKKNDP